MKSVSPSVAPRPMQGRGAVRRGVPGWLLTATAFVLPLALHVATASRDVFWMDSTEFMLAGRLLAVSHPPGYPLLTLAVRLISLIPVLALPLRLNLLSSLAAAGSCLFLFLLVRHITSDRVAALLTALAWGVSFELWQQATALEAYALQTLLVSGLIYAAVRWAAPTDEPRDVSRARAFLLASFVLGLALANHLFVVWLVPGLLVLLFSGRWRGLKPRLGFIGLGLLLLGPLLYLYVLLRAGPAAGIGWGGIRSLPDLVQFLTASPYRYRFLAGGPDYLQAQLRALPLTLGRQFTLLWLLLVPGVVALWAGSRRLLLALTLAAAATFAAALAYNIPDKEGYFLPTYLCCSVMIGAGIARLRRSRMRLGVTLAILLLTACSAAWFYSRQDRSRLHGLADLSRSLVKELPDSSVLFTNEYSAFQGTRWNLTFENPHRDILVVSEHHLAFPWYLEQLDSRLPVPDLAFALARRLWNSAGRVSHAAFGEDAKATTEFIRYELVRTWMYGRRVFWVPREFGEWTHSWRDLSLTLHGLCYEVLAEPAISTTDPVFTFPGPDQYSTSRFRDPETRDLCLRFAATANRRGMLRHEAGNTDAALTDFDLALAYFPEYGAAVENKGLVHAISGEPDSARVYLVRYLELEPNSPEVPKVKSVLAGLRHP